MEEYVDPCASPPPPRSDPFAPGSRVREPGHYILMMEE